MFQALSGIWELSCDDAMRTPSPLRARTRQIMDKMWKIFKNLVMLLVNYNIICIIFRFDHWYNLYLPVVRVGSELWYERLFLVCSSSCSVARALRILILTFSINPFPSPLYPVHTNTVFNWSTRRRSRRVRFLMGRSCHIGSHHDAYVVSYHHLDLEVVPRRSSKSSSLSVKF